MKKYLSRKMTRLAFVFWILTTIFAVIGLFSGEKIPLVLALILLVITCCLMLHANRCPYCGEVFRGVRWSKPDAGYCNKCGKLMVYDDCDENFKAE